MDSSPNSLNRRGSHPAVVLKVGSLISHSAASSPEVVHLNSNVKIMEILNLYVLLIRHEFNFKPKVDI